MVKKLAVQSLTAEVAAVETLLEGRSAEDDPVGHFQYAQRLARLRAELEGLDYPELTGSVALFFAGAPVVGSHGIRADFAGKAVEKFQDIVSKRFAASEVGDLGERGPVPLRANSELLLTNVARGSFGVVLEEADTNQPLTETQMKVVLDDVVQTIQTAAVEENEPFDTLLETIDHRYLRALGGFFELLDDQAATVRVVEGERDHQFTSLEIHRARERTSATQIDERDDERLAGTLFLLPGPRRFELVLDEGVSISGTVSREFANAHLEDVGHANDVVGRRWRVRARTRTVTRPNYAPKVTYRLLGLVERLD
jgi:hypothetical protein